MYQSTTDVKGVARHDKMRECTDVAANKLSHLTSSRQAPQQHRSVYCWFGLCLAMTVSESEQLTSTEIASTQVGDHQNQSYWFITFVRPNSIITDIQIKFASEQHVDLLAK